jgi:hypothetical protein
VTVQYSPPAKRKPIWDDESGAVQRECLLSGGLEGYCWWKISPTRLLYRYTKAENVRRLRVACSECMFTVFWECKKVKQSHNTSMEAQGRRMYSSYSFTSSALDGCEWSASRPGRALPPEKGPLVPIVQEAGWAPEPVWTQRLQEKSFRLSRGSNLDRPVVHPVARHYTD